MPIEKELEKLHEHLKALGSAREKLDGATEHIANVSDAIVDVGESMRRLAEWRGAVERDKDHSRSWPHVRWRRHL